MAYYKKSQVFEYIEDNDVKISESGLKPLTPKDNAINQLNSNEDVIGFFWFELIQSVTDKSIVSPKMEGKLFIRIGEDLYTDDRYAADEYQAKQEGKTIVQVVEERENAKEEAKKTITTPPNVENIVNAFESKLKNHGT